jgi:predicted RNase H-like HicB family nuclease
MPWNFRVVKKKGDLGYGIHEVFYKDNGDIEAVTQDPVEPLGETFEELKKDLQRMLDACKKEVIDYDRLFPKSSRKSDSSKKKKHRRNK